MIPIDNEHRLITLSLLQAVMIPFDSEHTLSLLQAVRITVDSEHTDHIVTVTGCHIPVDCEHRLITLSWLQAVTFPLTVNTD